MCSFSIKGLNGPYFGSYWEYQVGVSILLEPLYNIQFSWASVQKPVHCIYIERNPYQCWAIGNW